MTGSTGCIHSLTRVCSPPDEARDVLQDGVSMYAAVGYPYWRSSVAEKYLGCNYDYNLCAMDYI